MAKTTTSAEVKNRYNAKVYDRLNIIVPKGDRDIIKAAAESAGESLNAFVCSAISQRMKSIPGGGIPASGQGASNTSDDPPKIKKSVKKGSK